MCYVYKDKIAESMYDQLYKQGLYLLLHSEIPKKCMMLNTTLP